MKPTPYPLELNQKKKKTTVQRNPTRKSNEGSVGIIANQKSVAGSARHTDRSHQPTLFPVEIDGISGDQQKRAEDKMSLIPTVTALGRGRFANGVSEDHSKQKEGSKGKAMNPNTQMQFDFRISSSCPSLYTTLGYNPKC
jgi:hypothetical protein